VRVTLGVEILHVDEPQQADHALPTLLGGPDAMDHQAFHNALTDGHAWVERREWILEDDLHLAAQILHVTSAKLEDVLTIEEDRSIGVRDQA